MSGTERVSTISPMNPHEPVEPIIIISPHMEQNTDKITEHMAKELNCYAVINRGWERSDKVDFMNDKANCNNIEHCLEDVVREEFLEPIFAFANKIRRSNMYNIYVFLIHGAAFPKNQKNPDVIIGCGNKKRPSCPTWRKNAFIHFMLNEGIITWAGKAGGPYTGQSVTNMNQLFTQEFINPDTQELYWNPDDYVSSFQLEILDHWRKTETDSIIFADHTVKAIQELVELGDEGFAKEVLYQEF